jgi:hypothetical protein
MDGVLGVPGAADLLPKVADVSKIRKNGETIMCTHAQTNSTRIIHGSTVPHQSLKSRSLLL